MFKFVLVLFLIISVKEFHRNEMQFEKTAVFNCFSLRLLLEILWSKSISSEKSGSVRKKSTDILIIFFCFLFFISLQKKHITITGIQRLKERRDNNKGYINDSEIFFAWFFFLISIYVIKLRMIYSCCHSWIVYWHHLDHHNLNGVCEVMWMLDLDWIDLVH